MNDVYNSHQGTPESTWRKSFLSFNLSDESGVEVIPESVVLEHYSESGERIMPSKVESTVSKCSGKQGCRESVVMHYERGMPEKLLEKSVLSSSLMEKKRRCLIRFHWSTNINTRFGTL